MENNIQIRTDEESLMQATVSREVASVQASLVVAKRFPRDVLSAIDRIKTACQRKGLAENSLYSYSRGGTEITGPSIRLAEELARQYGNLDFGIRELEQKAGESVVEAYCWDLETNTRQVKIFTVPHKRFTKSGSYELKDGRDIYEAVANNGARRLRACILGIIPADIVEDAVIECENTMKASADVTPEAMKKLINAFEELGVTRQQIEERIQRRIDSITPAQVVSLRKIFRSLKDGMSAPEDWFKKHEEKTEEAPEVVKHGVAGLKAKLKKNDEPKVESLSSKKEPKKQHTVSEDTISCPLENGKVISVIACESCTKSADCPEYA